jgi:hypothetical protein
MVTFPYNTIDYAFTLDPVFINFTSANESFFTAYIFIRYYDFYASEEKTIDLNYKIPLFNGVAKFHIGDIIHRNLANLETNYADGFQVKTALVNVFTTEWALADESVIAYFSMSNIKFIAGFKPKLLANNMALLSINSNYCRVTSNGHCTVNFLASAGVHTLNIFKNTTEIASEAFTASALDTIYTKSLDVSSLVVAPGDVIKFEIEGTTIKKEFIVFPDTEFSNTLFYINNHKVISSLELTGGYSFPNEYDQITHKYKRNLVEILEIVETLDERFIKINTGYILKTQTEVIDEIFNAKKVIIKNMEGKDFEMVPVSKKMVGVNTDNFTYSYDLEFRINKKADA